MVTYFKDKKQKSKKGYNKYKTLNTILESVDTIIIGLLDYVIIGPTSTSKNRSITCIGWNILPISAGVACTLSLGNKVRQNIIINE